MKITRNIPARTETYNVLWMKKDFMNATPRYFEIREKVGGGLTSCFGCGWEFKDGDMITLACLEGRGNKTFCQGCADKVEKERDE